MSGFDFRQAQSSGELVLSLRKPWPSRSTSWTSIASVADAILVNAPTLGGGNLLQGQAVAISCTTGIYALLSGLSRRKGERGEIGVARIECSNIQRQKYAANDCLLHFIAQLPSRSK